MTLAWTRNDLPVPLSSLPEELLAWAKGLYNGFAIAETEEPVRLTLEIMLQSTRRDAKKAQEQIAELTAQQEALAQAGPQAPESIQTALAGVEQALARANASGEMLRERTSLLSNILEELTS